MPRLSVDNKQDNAEERLKERLAAEENRTLLRFLTCGSVDDGKSTLIGRLLFDSAQIYEDQLKSAERATRSVRRQRRARPCAPGRRPPGRARAEDHHRRRLSLFLDAAPQIHRRRYAWPCAVHAQHGDGRFQLRLRRAPGRCGFRRHARIVSLLGIRKLALAVNKMDLVDFSQARFDAIADDFKTFAAPLGFESITCIPVSALKGDNVIVLSPHMHWYRGPTLLGHLETVDVSREER